LPACAHAHVENPIDTRGLEPDRMLSRHATAAILSAMGFRITPATLATKASRGGGPPYQLFGRTTIYRWGSALAWAESLLTPPRAACSKAKIRRRSRPIRRNRNHNGKDKLDAAMD
jgi:hypothetical protein